MKIVVATSNAGKVREFHRLLAPIACLGLDAFEPFEPAVEDGQTFEANALKKARVAVQHLGLPCLADDSGLVVDALEGAPGVYSARYAGEDATDRANYQKLLRALEGERARTARFVCSLVLVRPDGAHRVARGEVEGVISAQARGEGGFGYDPVFEANAHRRADGSAPTLAEAGRDAKNAISHRAKAVEALLRDTDLAQWLAAD